MKRVLISTLRWSARRDTPTPDEPLPGAPGLGAYTTLPTDVRQEAQVRILARYTPIPQACSSARWTARSCSGVKYSTHRPSRIAPAKSSKSGR